MPYQRLVYHLVRVVSTLYIRLDDHSLLQFDLRVRCASPYKTEDYEHDRKKEQLVASAVIASQQIA